MMSSLEQDGLLRKGWQLPLTSSRPNGGEPDDSAAAARGSDSHRPDFILPALFANEGQAMARLCVCTMNRCVGIGERID